MIEVLLVAAGGGIGAILRHLTSSRLGSARGTIAVNLAGSFLLGLLTGAATHLSPSEADYLLAVAGSGFAGGFTTFSTASVVSVQLAEFHGSARAFTYAFAMLAGACLAAFAGLVIAQ